MEQEIIKLNDVAKYYEMGESLVRALASIQHFGRHVFVGFSGLRTWQAHLGLPPENVKTQL